MFLEPNRTPRRVFLLSPANAGGERAQMLLRDRAQFEVAVRVRNGSATLGEVFSFLSGLYFRGKMAYSRAFAAPPASVPASMVITTGSGLMPPETLISIAELREFASVSIDGANPRFLEPLRRDATALAAAVGADCSVVLLGSVATAKYVDPLLEIFGERLLFPSEFVGRGDMSRGGLMLRCAASGDELTYVPVLGTTRHGARPPKLPKIPRPSRSGNTRV